MNSSVHHHHCSNSIHGVIFALLLIIVGVVFVCANVGAIQPEWKWVLVSWQMLLVAIGLMLYTDRNLISGSIFFFVGLFFLVPKLDFLFPNMLAIDFVNTYWPVLLIVLGVAFLALGVTKKYWKKNICSNSGDFGYKSDRSIEDASVNEDGRINYKFLFSGSENVFLDPVFKGGSIEITCGGIEFDLRRTSLPEGTTTLYINVTLGGAVLYIPQSWNVEVQNQSIMGAFDDHRFKHGENKDYSRKLIIVAKCTLGGGEIK